ncbi:MAG: CoA ester lyase [Oligoflexia bacterium]|nr:CoA ester lyase [Oligoflexia bacterium]
MARKSAISIHPEQVLFGSQAPLAITCCDHYVGRIDYLAKAVDLRRNSALAFDITCDLEDGAVAGEESQLLAAYVNVLSSEFKHEQNIGLRIHDGSSSFWRKEVSTIIAALGAQISHITVPKVKSAQQLRSVATYVKSCAKKHKLKRGIPLHVLIETLSALDSVSEIAAVEGVRCLDFGLMDFVSEHSGVIPATCMRSPGQFEHQLIVRAKTNIVAAACAHGIAAAHNVTTAFADTQQTFNDAQIARTRYGFTRMWSIHPSQIEPIIKAMRPSEDEVTVATRVIEGAIRAHWGPIKLDNTLHDRASFRYYWNLLKRAHQAGYVLDTNLQDLLSLKGQ